MNEETKEKPLTNEEIRFLRHMMKYPRVVQAYNLPPTFVEFRINNRFLLKPFIDNGGRPIHTYDSGRYEYMKFIEPEVTCDLD